MCSVAPVPQSNRMLVCCLRVRACAVTRSNKRCVSALCQPGLRRLLADDHVLYHGVRTGVGCGV